METLLLAASLGLAAGLSPGPLFTMVLSSTLERGFAAGLRIAVAPLLTDTLMLAVVTVLLSHLTETVLRGAGLVGGAVVCWIGVQTLRASFQPPPGSAPAKGAATAARDLWRGAAVNMLNPHAWLFWVTVGGPIVARTWPESPLTAGGFFLLFETFIVGSKIALAWVVARARQRIQGGAYPWVLRILALALLAFGARLFLEAWP
jgi:threonine/homoserine/homoserine lactone efflux protein